MRGEEVNDDGCSYPLKHEHYHSVNATIAWVMCGGNKWEWAGDVMRFFFLFISAAPWLLCREGRWRKRRRQSWTERKPVRKRRLKINLREKVVDVLIICRHCLSLLNAHYVPQQRRLNWWNSWKPEPRRPAGRWKLWSRALLLRSCIRTPRKLTRQKRQLISEREDESQTNDSLMWVCVSAKVITMESQEAPILRLSMSDKRWAKTQNRVKMKQMTTTKRNHDVPGFQAGDAHDMQITANSYRINK